MRFSELAEIAASVLVSLGGGGAIVFGLSNWLGRVWAERLMERERARYQNEIEDFKAELTRESDRVGQRLREKLALYKDAISPVVELVMLYQAISNEGKTTLLLEFEKKRLATTALLGMFAPLPVFEAYNALIDYLYDCMERKRAYQFAEFRLLAFAMLSQIRRDLGVEGETLTYRGNR